MIMKTIVYNNTKIGKRKLKGIKRPEKKRKIQNETVNTELKLGFSGM